MSSARAVLATRSEHKLLEIRAILGDAVGGELVSLGNLGIEEAPEEQGIEAFETFTENALAKARYFANVAGLTAIADDSGICVDALGGAPGVHSKRFAGRDDLSGAALDAENNRRLLEQLDGVPPERRTAHYICVAAVVYPTGEEIVVEGRCDGIILARARGQGGFGYDPLFLVDGYDRTFGELPPEVKNRISHRARAFQTLRHRFRRD